MEQILLNREQVKDIACYIKNIINSYIKENENKFLVFLREKERKIGE